MLDKKWRTAKKLETTVIDVSTGLCLYQAEHDVSQYSQPQAVLFSTLPVMQLDHNQKSTITIYDSFLTFLLAFIEDTPRSLDANCRCS